MGFDPLQCPMPCQAAMKLHSRLGVLEQRLACLQFPAGLHLLIQTSEHALGKQLLKSPCVQLLSFGVDEGVVA